MASKLGRAALYFERSAWYCVTSTSSSVGCASLSSSSLSTSTGAEEAEAEGVGLPVPRPDADEKAAPELPCTRPSLVSSVDEIVSGRAVRVLLILVSTDSLSVRARPQHKPVVSTWNNHERGTTAHGIINAALTDSNGSVGVGAGGGARAALPAEASTVGGIGVLADVGDEAG